MDHDMTRQAREPRRARSLLGVPRPDDPRPARRHIVETSYGLARLGHTNAKGVLAPLARMGEDASVQVPETRTRRRRTPSRHRPASEAVTPVLGEFPRS
jgi:hypothetical protein